MTWQGLICRWDSPVSVSSSRWVIKLNAYETIEWNYVLRVVVSSMFRCILSDMTFLETNAMTLSTEMSIYLFLSLCLVFLLFLGTAVEHWCLILYNLFFVFAYAGRVCEPASYYSTGSCCTSRFGKSLHEDNCKLFFLSVIVHIYFFSSKATVH